MMGKSTWIGLLVVAVMAGRGFALPATPVVIAEIEDALDQGEAQQAARLADVGLAEKGGPQGRLLLYRGLAEELLGAQEPAMRDFTAALDSQDLPAEERAEALLQRGFLRDGLGRLDMAVADYSAVIALKGPGLSTALNNRANIYRRQNRLEEARRGYQAALSAPGGKPQYPWYGLGQIAEAEADPEAARTYYAKAVAADPAYALASERLGALGGPPDGAISQPDQMIQLHPPSIGYGAQPAVQQSLADGTIQLRPPRTASAKGIVGQGPREPRLARASAGPRPAMHPAGLVLRPALDQPRGDRPAAGASGEVQLGAWRSEEEAHAGWEKARKRASGALDGLGPHILAVDLPGKGRYYRLRVAPKEARTAFCAGLAEKGLDCIPVRD